MHTNFLFLEMQEIIQEPDHSERESFLVVVTVVVVVAGGADDCAWWLLVVMVVTDSSCVKIVGQDLQMHTRFSSL